MHYVGLVILHSCVGHFFACMCCNGAAKIEIDLIGWCLFTSTFWAEIIEEDDAVGCLRGKIERKGVIKTNPAGRREVLFQGESCS